MKQFCVFLAIIYCFSSIFAQIPAGYYNSATGKSGYELKIALSNIISGHHSISYSDVWTAFATTDTYSDGNTIWDIYSDNPQNGAAYTYQYQIDQCGSGGTAGENVCYQREHAFCRSWFGGTQNAPYTDLFHIYPVDGYINLLRSNNPYGIVANPARIFTNGSLLGQNSAPNSPSGTAYEPVDEYKGDLARSFFYMATRYMFEDNNFSTTQLMTYKSQLKPWAIDMMLLWNLIDPVSDKERERNNAIYSIQQNRNPYIDFPELAMKIWGNDSILPFLLIDTSLPYRPVIENYNIIDNRTICLNFSIDLITNTAIQISNYILDGNNHVTSANCTNKTVTLTLSNDLINGKTYHLIIKNVQGENLYFIKDTSINFMYGYPVNKVVLSAWTFDSLQSSPNINKTILSNIGYPYLSTIYMNGEYGSSNFDSLTQITAYEGTLVGDPRIAPFKGKSLAIQNQSANGYKMTFKCSSYNYKFIILSLASRKTSSGFNSHLWEYSLDGNVFYPIENASTLSDTNSIFNLHTLDLQNISDLDNRNIFFLRLMLNGAFSSSGNNRFDNIVLHGVPLEASISFTDRDNNNLFIVYPNPAEDHIYIKQVDENNNFANKYIELYDAKGVLLGKQMINSTELKISTSSIREGVYFLKIYVNSQLLSVKKVIINK